jgi:hypothetical protein
VANKTARETDSGRATRLGIIGALIAVLGGGAWLYLRHEPPPREVAPVTAEAKAYVKFLKISEPELKEVSSYMAVAKIYEITGKITNNGDKVVNSADLMCVFYDPYGQIVYRDRAPLVKAREGGLKPGQTKPFRLPFESLPESWNQGMPQIVIASIEFGS